MKRLLIPALAAAALLVGVPQAAQAGTGVKLGKPKQGATVKSGTYPKFTASVKGKGSVYIVICKSKQRDREGKLCFDADTSKMKKSGKKGSARLFSFSPKHYTFPGFYLVTPGTYYWQVFRIDCVDDGDGLDCIQESKVRKFRVTG